MENWLWEAACKIRGEIDAPKYKDYILPLVFLKRLSDVFDDELTKLSRDLLNVEMAEQLVEGRHKWFYMLSEIAESGEEESQQELTEHKESPWWRRWFGRQSRRLAVKESGRRFPVS